MEKLIPLLNEKTGKEWVLDSSSFGEDWLFLKGHPEVKIKEEKLISKKYGFIKWLVENDKIEREKFGNSKTKSSRYLDYELSYNNPREDYINILLMELAISDNPIEFLISILK